MLDATPTTAETLAAYSSGKPAAFLNKYGKGEAMLVGALFGEAYINRHYPENLFKDGVLQSGWDFNLGAETTALITNFIDRAQIVRPLSLSVAGIYTSIMETPDSTLVFFNNASGHPLSKVTVRLKNTGKISSVKSIDADKVSYKVIGDELVFDMPLKHTEIVQINH